MRQREWLPHVRQSLLSGLAEFRDLDPSDQDCSAIFFDNMTAEFMWLLEDDEDLANFLGSVLRDPVEVRPLAGLRATFLCLDDRFEGTYSFHQLVSHPYLAASICVADYAYQILEAVETGDTGKLKRLNPPYRIPEIPDLFARKVFTALEALSGLDVDVRLARLDVARDHLPWLWSSDDLPEEFLVLDREAVQALDGVRCAIRCLGDRFHRIPSAEDLVAHPHLVGLAVVASHALVVASSRISL